MISRLARLREFRDGMDIKKYLQTEHRQNLIAVQNALNNPVINEFLLVNFLAFGTELLNAVLYVVRFQENPVKCKALTLVQSNTTGDYILVNESGCYAITMPITVTGGTMSIISSGSISTLALTSSTIDLTISAIFYAKKGDQIRVVSTTNSTPAITNLRMVKIA